MPVLANRTIEQLLLDDNEITNLAPFVETPYMNLFFANNRITDLSPILTFPSPPVLFLDVRGNPFDCAQQADIIAAAAPMFVYTECM